MLNKNDVKIETMMGQGPGGQHKQKTDSCVRVTHIPTGISVTIDGRYQGKNKKLALKELERRVNQLKQKEKAAAKKERRDNAIKTRNIIRTYDYRRGTVKDHRSGKTAPLKEVMGKGRIELLR